MRSSLAAAKLFAGYRDFFFTTLQLKPLSVSHCAIAIEIRVKKRWAIFRLCQHRKKRGLVAQGIVKTARGNTAARLWRRRELDLRQITERMKNNLIEFLGVRDKFAIEAPHILGVTSGRCDARGNQETGKRKHHDADQRRVAVDFSTMAVRHGDDSPHSTLSLKERANSI